MTIDKYRNYPCAITGKKLRINENMKDSDCSSMPIVKVLMGADDMIYRQRHSCVPFIFGISKAQNSFLQKEDIIGDS